MPEQIKDLESIQRVLAFIFFSNNTEEYCFCKKKEKKSFQIAE